MKSGHLGGRISDHHKPEADLTFNDDKKKQLKEAETMY